MEKRPQALSRRYIPHPDQPITTTTHDQTTIMHKVHAADGIRVRRELPHHARSANVPEVDGFVVGTADEHVAGGTERDAVDVVVVAEEGEGVRVAGGGGPETD